MPNSLPSDFTVVNHYVPRWYQHGFIPGDARVKRYHYLDLCPERISHPGGGHHYRRADRLMGPDICFEQKHLYTLFFEKYASDVIEKRFFGAIDSNGADAVSFFSDYQANRHSGEAAQHLVRYIDAQKLRTPKGLDFLKKLSGPDHRKVLLLMRHMHEVHVTIWMEGVWEVVNCDSSETKFIVTDHPVTTYNRAMFPKSAQCLYPQDAPIDLLGTQTIFPLNMSRCLVITNLGYVRNPDVKPTARRQNPRSFANTMWDIRTVQTGRQLSETEVQAINFIMKSRARRYIAAAKKDWLYPERYLTSTMWNKLGDRFFLMPDPRKVQFTTEYMVGFADGSAWGHDEYGRRSRRDDHAVKTLRDAEFAAHQRHKARWTARFGPLENSKSKWSV
jgi:hypothetical protein